MALSDSHKYMIAEYCPSIDTLVRADFFVTVDVA